MSSYKGRESISEETNRILCLIEGVDRRIGRHIGQLSADISVDILAECRSSLS